MHLVIKFLAPPSYKTGKNYFPNKLKLSPLKNKTFFVVVERFGKLKHNRSFLDFSIDEHARLEKALIKNKLYSNNLIV